MDINKALKLLAEKNGSELFITVGFPPCLKVNNQLLHASSAQLTNEHVRKGLQSIMGEHRYTSFCETMESNYAFDLEDIGRFRVSAFFQKGEPGMVIRRIHTEIPTMESLGLPEVLGEKILAKRGLILLTGSAGSGKSTSMAALVNHRNLHGKGHIITIEDPIEFVHSHNNCIITQREVGLDTASYEEGLGNALRQAPNLVVIGEIRSPQVMKHTLEFVETGHLCIATMHANSTYQAFERIIHFFPQEQHPELLLDLSLSVNAIVGQQLIPSKDNSSVQAVHEVLLNSPRMTDLIRTGKMDEMSELIERSVDEGMQTTDHALFKLYTKGAISYEQAMHHAGSSNNLRLMIKMQGQPEEMKSPTNQDDDFDIDSLTVSKD
ncbi:type IV pili twitching motility protein PilT [Endozoicomonas sp. (ex Bugula neritina AB1)]|nr:type IV pili twitching motility protein PilT [Endozoicomonas sp. (ex Bugula neritina AB1)]